ncbi:MAG: transporter substrate-binding domain-containing protein, partial [Methylobacter sp.]
MIWILMRFLIISLLLIVTGQAPAGESQILPKTLVVGSEPDFPPFALGKTEETADGFSVELWKAVALESNINYTFRVRPFYQLLEEFKKGQIDVLVNLAESDERKRYADFTVPTMIDKGAIFVRKGQAAIHSEADLIGKSIIVMKGGLVHDYALSKGWQKQLVQVKDAEEGMKLLAAGKHDVMLMVKLPGMQTIKKLKLSNIHALDIGIGNALKLSFAVRKGESDLLAEINDGLALTKSNGVYGKLFDKWFGVYEESEILDRILNRYLAPVALILAVFFGYIYYKWRAERKFAQQQILNYQQRTQLALEGADLGLWDWDVPSGNVFFNERWCNMLGYQADEIASHLSSWETLVHPDDWAV